ILDGDVFALDEPRVIQALPQRIDKICEAGSWRAPEEPDHRHCRLLRPRRQRPRRRAAEQRDEFAALHSITSSAPADMPIGTSRPSAFAVFKLITKSNLVVCITGSSAGFSPLRTRPV